MKFLIFCMVAFSFATSFSKPNSVSLICKPRFMMPEYTSFKLTGPNKKGQYTLEISSQFYGLIDKRKATVKANATGYSGADIKITLLEKLSDDSMRMLFKSKDVSESEMICE